MSENVIIIITTTLGPIILALIGLRALRLQQKNVITKVEENTEITKIVETKLNIVADNVDGKIEKLLVATGAAERAEGKEEGRQQMKAEVANGVVKVEIINDKKDDKPTPE